MVPVAAPPVVVPAVVPPVVVPSAVPPVVVPPVFVPPVAVPPVVAAPVAAPPVVVAPPAVAPPAVVPPVVEPFAAAPVFAPAAVPAPDVLLAFKLLSALLTISALFAIPVAAPVLAASFVVLAAPVIAPVLTLTATTSPVFNAPFELSMAAVAPLSDATIAVPLALSVDNTVAEIVLVADPAAVVSPVAAAVSPVVTPPAGAVDASVVNPAGATVVWPAPASVEPVAAPPVSAELVPATSVRTPVPPSRVATAGLLTVPLELISVLPQETGLPLASVPISRSGLMVGSTLTTDVPSVAPPPVVVLVGTPASVVTPPLVLAGAVVALPSVLATGAVVESAAALLPVCVVPAGAFTSLGLTWTAPALPAAPIVAFTTVWPKPVDKSRPDAQLLKILEIDSSGISVNISDPTPLPSELLETFNIAPSSARPMGIELITPLITAAGMPASLPAIIVAARA